MSIPERIANPRVCQGAGIQRMLARSAFDPSFTVHSLVDHLGFVGQSVIHALHPRNKIAEVAYFRSYTQLPQIDVIVTEGGSGEGRLLLLVVCREHPAKPGTLLALTEPRVKLFVHMRKRVSR